jgi:hypothetical protein
MVNLLLVCNCGTLSIFQRALAQAAISATVSRETSSEVTKAWSFYPWRR